MSPVAARRRQPVPTPVSPWQDGWHRDARRVAGFGGDASEFGNFAERFDVDQDAGGDGLAELGVAFAGAGEADLVGVGAAVEGDPQLAAGGHVDAIDEARETGEPVDLKPMNSFERKIIHDVVREEGMKSRSHGEEPHRYVTVYVKASAADDADEIDEA